MIEKLIDLYCEVETQILVRKGNADTYEIHFQLEIRKLVKAKLNWNESEMPLLVNKIEMQMKLIVVQLLVINTVRNEMKIFSEMKILLC